eukprot:Pgem_evm1s14698
MNGNTLPGLDGIPAKVYQLFWNEIKQILVPLMKQIFNNMKASNNFGQGIIVLNFKKGDKSDLPNYRPITLLNSDYKLFMKITTSRLVPILPTIISPGQTCNVPGRIIEDTMKFMQTNIWKMNRNCDLFSYNQSQILNTDVKKAFDTLEWEFLFKVLEEMRFPEVFISLIKNLYENGFSIVSINGFFSSGFFKAIGVNQGDPLSPILYIIAGEVLRLRLTAETKVITASYADDANYITKNQQQTLEVLKIVKSFEEEVTGNMIHL